MALFLDKIDTVPVINTDIDRQLMQWLGVLVDTLNEDMTRLENIINASTVPSFTATQINDQFVAGTLNNGVILYDTTNNEYVGMVSGVLMQFNMIAYP